MKYPLVTNIEDFVTWNARGREIETLYQHQKLRAASRSDQPLGPLLHNAIRNSTLGPFIFEFNQKPGLVSVESQQATLDLLKFSYCKAGEAAVWNARAAIFPHIQYAVRFIEDALRENCKDGKITLAYVHKRLSCLNLHDRDLTTLDSALASFTGLRYLNLSWNLIESAASFTVPSGLCYLNLEMNLLEDFLLPAQTTPCYLTYLNLSRNRIADSSDLCVLRCLSHLLMLDLSYNDLHTLDTLWPAVNVTQLRSLNMIGNPCSVTADYLLNVIHHVPMILFLDHVPVSDQMKKDIQESSAGTGPFSDEAELRFHCYRTLRFAFVDASLPSPPSKESLRGKRADKKKSRKKTTKEKSVKSTEPPPPPPPPATNPLTELFYGFEIESPILNQSLLDLVAFLAESHAEEALVPEELLNRTTLKPPDEIEKTGPPPEKENPPTDEQGQNALENQPQGMTVGEARKIVTSLKENGGVNEAFKSIYVSNALPEAPVMQFSPILIKPPHNDLSLLSTMFYTQVKINFVQLQVLKEHPPSKESVKAQRRTKGGPKSTKAPPKPVELKIVGRTILHSILLDELTEPTWEDGWRDFVWTQSELKSAEPLKDLYYSTGVHQEEKKGGKQKQKEVRESTPLPEELTIHFGVSLKRTHQVMNAGAASK